MNKLNAKAMGLSFGILWGIGVILMGLLSTYSNYGLDFVTLLGSVYIGYKSSFIGALVGGIWGFFDGSICGFLITWVYNKFSN